MIRVPREKLGLRYRAMSVAKMVLICESQSLREVLRMAKEAQEEVAVYQRLPHQKDHTLIFKMHWRA